MDAVLRREGQRSPGKVVAPSLPVENDVLPDAEPSLSRTGANMTDTQYAGIYLLLFSLALLLWGLAIRLGRK
jgi:hypothetical protein